MAHGIKPYGMTEAQETIFGVHDLGELAARTDSIVTFDRLGNVVWYDDFEAGIYHWDLGAIGPPGFWHMSYTSARNGLCSACMQPGVAAGSQRILEHHNPYNREGGIALEASWSLEHDSGVIQQRLRAYSTAQSLEVGIRYNPTTDVLEYLDAGLLWAPLAPNPALGIPAPGLHRRFRLFHTCKIVVNTLTGQYLRILLDNLRYPMAGIPTSDLGVSPTAYVRIQLIEEGGDVAVNYSYWDDVILTQNEP